MRPRDVLQMQADLRTSLLNPEWVTVLDWMLASMEVQARSLGRLTLTGDADLMSKNHSDLVRRQLDMGNREGQWFIDRERRTLSLALAFLVTEHMHPLIRMAASDFPEDLPLEPDVLPSPDGFLVFDRAWESRDVRQSQILVKVITWRTEASRAGKRGGVVVNEYSSHLEPDEISRKIRLTNPETYAQNRRLGILQFHHTYFLPWGSTLASHVPEGTPDYIRDAAVGPARALRTIWHFMQQEIADVRPEKMTAKRQALWQRKRIRGEVVTVTLRRRSMHSEHADEVQQRDFCWPVRGHWHGYWVGTGEDRRLVKKYVHPFFKGNLDGPVRETKKVNVLAR